MDLIATFAISNTKNKLCPFPLDVYNANCIKLVFNIIFFSSPVIKYFGSPVSYLIWMIVLGYSFLVITSYLLSLEYQYDTCSCLIGSVFITFFKKILINFERGQQEGEKHWLVAFYTHSDRGWNQQFRHVGTID